MTEREALRKILALTDPRRDEATDVETTAEVWEIARAALLAHPSPSEPPLEACSREGCSAPDGPCVVTGVGWVNCQYGPVQTARKGWSDAKLRKMADLEDEHGPVTAGGPSEPTGEDHE